MDFSKPARNIPKNYSNITGKISDNYSKRLISFESKLEREFLYLFQFENMFIKILEQPIKIKYQFEGSSHTYTPDFYLETPKGYRNLIIEVKYYDILKKTFKEYKPRYKAIVEHLKNSDTDFHFYTDRCDYIKSDAYRFNVSFLLNYNELSDENYKVVKEFFHPYISVQELLTKYSSDKYKQLNLVTTIWAMIRRKVLLVNLFEKITLNTQLIQLREYSENKYNLHLEGKIEGGYLL